jgi:hypothetical protein
LPDDLGIQYQSYPKQAIVAEDEFISIHPGLGHTGSHPFDDHNGWYRSYRSLAGTVSYRVKPKGWTIFDHLTFPNELKDSVKTALLCQTRQRQLKFCPGKGASDDSYHPVVVLPPFLLNYIFEFMVRCMMACKPREAMCSSQLYRMILCHLFQHWDWFEEQSDFYVQDDSVGTHEIYEV